jgi:methylglyoxal synthase
LGGGLKINTLNIVPSTFISIQLYSDGLSDKFLITKRNIALVAHDNKKEDLGEWADFNKGTLALHNLYATGDTGKRVMAKTGLAINLLKSGSYGGDMEIGSFIANEKLDYLIFFWDPLESLPHDVDVKALLRIAVLYNVPTACNRATADLIISSPLFQSEEYKRKTSVNL